MRDMHQQVWEWKRAKSKISNGDAVKRRKLPDGLRAARIATQKYVIADFEVSKVCHQVAP